MSKFGLDAIDVRILSAVQKHGQLSKTRLSEIVNLSPTPCLARLRKLAEAGYIRGYHADIALGRLCAFSEVIVTISLTHHRRSDFARFEDHIRGVDDIIECVATGGGIDYILKTICPNLTVFQQMMDSLLEAEIGIERYMIYVVTRPVKSTLPNIERLVQGIAK